MGDPLNRLRRFLAELKRRKVYRVAVAYLVVGFALLEGADIVFPRLGLPSWSVTLVIALVAVGFPLAVVLAWAFDVTPGGVERTPEPSESDGSVAGLIGIGFVALGLLAAATTAGWHLLRGGGEAPDVSEGSVAVLPFEISGSGAAEWRDAMVTMLSTGLDGAAGLRAIPDRTVFAVWEAGFRNQGSVTSEEALSVAREVGARYAVVGSGVGLGAETRLSAGVYDTGSGARLGQVQIQGSQDSVTALADELTRQLMGVLLEESGEGLPSVDLASVTTHSLPALRSFLSGKRHHRNGQIEAAIEDLEAAVEQDSSFALAYAELAIARGALWGGSIEGAVRAARRARDLAERLPERERGKVLGLYLRLVEGREQAAADTLRRLSETYPDDPTLWLQLGEALFHGNVPRGWPEADRAFMRAAELDPGFSMYWLHPTQLAFSLHRDSALASRRLRKHPDMPGSHIREHFGIVRDLVWGAGADRRRAFDRLDTVPVPTPYTLLFPLEHPVDLGLRTRVILRLRNRSDVDVSGFVPEVSRTSLARGRVRSALTEMRELGIDPVNAGCQLARARSVGLPVPDSALRSRLAASSVGTEASVDRLWCKGLFEATVEQTSDQDGRISSIRSATADARGGRLQDWVVEARIDELEGFRAWKTGELERAARIWAGSNESGAEGAIWRGDLYLQLGRLRPAEGWYLAAWSHPLAHERLGRVYEEMARPEEAVGAYRRFIAAWEDADPSLQDRVDRARERVEALGEEAAGA